MPELAPVGRVADPETLDLEPVVVPIVAYKIETREEVEIKIPFKPQMPPGVIAFIERMGGQTVGVNQAIVALNDLVMPEARERWSEFLEREDLAIDPETVAELIRSLVEHYGERPTRRSSSSSGSGRRSGRTSKAAASSTT